MLTKDLTQWTHDVYTMSTQRRCNVIDVEATLYRRHVSAGNVSALFLCHLAHKFKNATLNLASVGHCSGKFTAIL